MSYSALINQVLSSFSSSDRRADNIYGQICNGTYRTVELLSIIANEFDENGLYHSTIGTILDTFSSGDRRADNIYGQICNGTYRTVELLSVIARELDKDGTYKSLITSAMDSFSSGDRRADNIYGQICNGTYRTVELLSIIANIRNSAIEEAERIREQEKQQRREAYWIEHSKEKETLDNEKSDCLRQISIIKSKINELDKEREVIKGKMDAPVPAEAELKTLEDQRRELIQRRAQLGIFKIKEKKQLDSDVAAQNEKIRKMKTEVVDVQKAEQKESFLPQLKELEQQKNNLNREVSSLNSRISSIDQELTKDR